jgi:hypothetical protein
MPRFFFHIRSNGIGRSCDDLGLDFPDVQTACRQAWRAARDLIGVFAARSVDPRDHAIEIENQAGEVVLHLPFSEIFLQDFDDAAGATVAFPQHGSGDSRGGQEDAT